MSHRDFRLLASLPSSLRVVIKSYAATENSQVASGNSDTTLPQNGNNFLIPGE